MTTSFGARSTTDDVLAGVDLSGKRILVTGVSAGLGVETARALAAHGAQVVGAARDLDKARRATEAVGPRRPTAAGWSSSSSTSPPWPACAPAPTVSSPTAGRSTW
jgi:NAD(P)-dependent dehydrogenase (short-subunit alcohol dehydrogenase family)